MGSYRIFVEKYPEFQVEAASLLAELNENLQLKLKKLRLLNVYDLFGFTPELLEKSRYSVFGEIGFCRFVEIHRCGIPARTV